MDLRPSALERVAVRQIMTVDEPPRTNSDIRSASWPAGTTRPARRRSWPACASARGTSCSGPPPPTAPGTTGRSSPASSWRSARPFEERRGRPRSLTHGHSRRTAPKRVVHSSQQLANIRLTPPGGTEPNRRLWRRFLLKTSRRATRPPPRRSNWPTPAARGFTGSPGKRGRSAPSRICLQAIADPRENALERVDRRNRGEGVARAARRSAIDGRPARWFRSPLGHRPRGLARARLGVAGTC